MSVPTTTTSTRQPATDAQKYDSAIVIIERLVGLLNEALGLNEFSADGRRNFVTFGYIGNSGNGRDDRSWMVFLPHPGRVGTHEDHIGSFRTGDVEGARRTADLLHGALRLARWQAGR